MDDEVMVILSKDNRAFETAWFHNMHAAKKWVDKIRDKSNYLVTIFKGSNDDPVEQYQVMKKSGGSVLPPEERIMIWK